MLEGALAQLREDRNRLQQEVAAYKHQAETAWASERVENALLRERINDIAAEVTRIIRSPEISKRLIDQGVDPLGGTPEEFGRLIRAETVRFGKAVKESGAKAE